MDRRAYVAIQRRRRVVDAPPALIQRWDNLVLSEFAATHTVTFPAECPVGSTIVVWLMDDPFRTYSIAGGGNTFVERLNEVTAAAGGNKRGVFFIAENITTATQTVTVTTSTSTQLRLYAECWENLSNLSGGSNVSQVDGATGVSSTVTTDTDNCVLFTVAHTSPSKSPAAVSPSSLYRMNLAGAPPTTYTGAVSEHSLRRACGAAGSYANASTWPGGEGTANVRAVSLALRPRAIV